MIVFTPNSAHISILANKRIKVVSAVVSSIETYLYSIFRFPFKWFSHNRKERVLKMTSPNFGKKKLT